jgi:hypothetical protein
MEKQEVKAGQTKAKSICELMDEFGGLVIESHILKSCELPKSLNPQSKLSERFERQEAHVSGVSR